MADSPYRLLAIYCDMLFEPLRSPMGRVRRQILGDILKRTEAACDLACGTGTTAVELARRGIRIFAVDARRAVFRIIRSWDGVPFVRREWEIAPALRAVYLARKALGKARS